MVMFWCVCVGLGVGLEETWKDKTPSHQVLPQSSPQGDITNSGDKWKVICFQIETKGLLWSLKNL